MSKRTFIDMAEDDPTSSHLSLVASDRVAAAMIGHSLRRFGEVRPDLIKQGFPDRDPVVRLTPKSAIQDWLDQRTQRGQAHAKNTSGRSAPMGR